MSAASGSVARWYRPRVTNGVETAAVWGDGNFCVGVDGVFGEGPLNGVKGKTSNGTASGLYGENESTGFGVAGRGPRDDRGNRCVR